MDGEDLYRALAIVLQRSTDAEERSTAASVGLLATVDLLIDILAGKGVINEGHRRLLAKVRERARPERPRVRLRLLVDKYQQPNSAIDCDKRVHLCHARCCTTRPPLTTSETRSTADGSCKTLPGTAITSAK